MLLRTLFVALLLTALAETAIHGAHALARATLHRQALLALHEEMSTAKTLARRSLAQAISAGADPRNVLPTPLPMQRTCRLRAASGCVVFTKSRVNFQPVADPPSPSPCPSDGCVIYEQNNDLVEEGRVAMRLSATAYDAGGAALAARAGRVTFRTMRVPPYVSFGADADASVAGAAGGTGDDGGLAPSGNSPGTLIEVRYENALTGARIPANAWRAAVESTQPVRPAWPP